MLYYFNFEPIRKFINQDNQECYDSMVYTFLQKNGEYHYWNDDLELECNCCGKIEWELHSQWTMI